VSERRAGYRAGKGKTKPYRGEPYWEKEQPVEAAGRRVALSYYRQAGRLQVSRLYRDRESGEVRRGTTVTLDQEDLALHPSLRELLARVLEDWQ
jgi:hypothetical protein